MALQAGGESEVRVLIFGGRHFQDEPRLRAALDELALGWAGPITVIEGDAPGVDRLAGAWARSRGFADEKFPADWIAHGRAAGPIRNRRMRDEGRPDLGVEFPGGTGTASMRRLLLEAGIEVVTVAI